MTRPILTLATALAFLAALAFGTTSPGRAQSVEPPPSLNGLTGLGDMPSIAIPRSDGQIETKPWLHRYHPVTCLQAGRLAPCRMTDFTWVSIPPLTAGRDLRGVVEVICRVDVNGSLQGCQAGGTSSRSDMRLALKLTPSFQAPTTLRDGASTAGGYAMFHVLAFPTHPPTAESAAPSEREGAPDPFKVTETGNVSCRSRLDMKMHTLVLAGVVGLPAPTFCAPTEAYAEVKARFDRLRPVFDELATEALRCGRLGPIEEIMAKLPFPVECPNGGVDAVERIRALLRKSELLSLRIEPSADPNHVDSAPIKALTLDTGHNGFAITPGSSASEIVYAVGDELMKSSKEAGYEIRSLAPHWSYVLVSDPGLDQ